MNKEERPTENPVSVTFTPNEGSAYQRFEDLARALVAVPKRDLEEMKKAKKASDPVKPSQ